MNISLLDKPIVLSLNRAWQAIGHRTVKQALVALNGGGDGLPPALGLDIAYPKLEDGSWNFDRPLYLTPLTWSDWTQLPVRDFDFAVHTPRQAIRVPTVIIATQFDRMPVRMPRVTRQAIFERDGGVCQYTGEYVGKGGGNLDHVIPRHRGGRDSFENLVWAKREINSQSQPPAARGRPATHPPPARSAAAPCVRGHSRSQTSRLAPLPPSLIARGVGKWSGGPPNLFLRISRAILRSHELPCPKFRRRCRSARHR